MSISYNYPQIPTDYYWIKGQWRFVANASYCNAFAGVTYRTWHPNFAYGQQVANRMICPLQWAPSVSDFNYSTGFYTFVQVNMTDFPQPTGLTVPKPTRPWPTVTMAWPLPAYTGPNDVNTLYANDTYWPININYPVVKWTVSTGNSKQTGRTKGGKHQAIKNL
jgi:hypothetical protein